MFCQENGRPLQPEMVTRRFNKLVADAGLPKIRLHDLRHIWSSMLIHAQVPLFRVSRSLGHSSLSITTDMYGWLTAAYDGVVGGALDTVLTSAPTTNPRPTEGGEKVIGEPQDTPNSNKPPANRGFELSRPDVRP